MPNNLKITNKTRVTLYYSAWTGLRTYSQNQEFIALIRITFTNQKQMKRIWMKPTMRLTPLNWMISTEMKQPANYPQQPDDSTEELPESDDDEPKESHQVTRNEEASSPAALTGSLLESPHLQSLRAD